MASRCVEPCHTPRRPIANVGTAQQAYLFNKSSLPASSAV